MMVNKCFLWNLGYFLTPPFTQEYIWVHGLWLWLPSVLYILCGVMDSARGHYCKWTGLIADLQVHTYTATRRNPHKHASAPTLHLMIYNNTFIENFCIKPATYIKVYAVEECFNSQPAVFLFKCTCYWFVFASFWDVNTFRFIQFASAHDSREVFWFITMIINQSRAFYHR